MCRKISTPTWMYLSMCGYRLKHYVWSVNKSTIDSTVNLTFCEIIFTLRIRPVMDALCRKDTKVYAHSMYESVYAS